MEGNAVFVHIVGQVVVEAFADVLVDRLQLDEDQRQAVEGLHLSPRSVTGLTPYLEASEPTEETQAYVKRIQGLYSERQVD